MIPTVQGDALPGKLAEARGSPVEIFFADCGPPVGRASGDASPESDALPTPEPFRLWEVLRVLAAVRQEAK